MVHEDIDGSHGSDRMIPSMSYPSHPFRTPMGHCSQADQDQAHTNLRSNPMKPSQEQYHKNVFSRNGDSDTDTPPSQLPSHIFGIVPQHNDATTSSQSSIHGQFIPQLQHGPPPQFRHTSHFVANHRIQRLGVHQEQHHPLQNHQVISDPPMPGDNLHLETILPLSGDFPSDGTDGINVAGQPSSDYGNVPTATCSNQTSLCSQTSPSLSRQQEQEKEIIADLFGPCGETSSHAETGNEGNEGYFLQGFSNMSIGNGDNVGHHKVNWSGLGNGLDDGPSTQRIVGLGGVRLDWSTDVPFSASTAPSNHLGKSPWDSQ